MSGSVVHTEPLEGFRVLKEALGQPDGQLRAAILNLDIPDEPVVVKRRYERAFAGDARREAAADLGPAAPATAWPTASGSTLRDLPKAKSATSS